ncbi:unnamed protein product [Phytophthora fragariaefolia]|uniref:Unnamed protein product n=1 Tax=Phytophthora fragariaefolia TaxID=1490495 RepID=A0A9W7D8Z2_9STRA|nr:unnamed protein product [Phytophthora fragariaefolia]
MSGSSATWSTASSSTAPTTSSATATSTAASAGASTVTSSVMTSCAGLGGSAGTPSVTAAGLASTSGMLGGGFTFLGSAGSGALLTSGIGTGPGAGSVASVVASVTPAMTAPVSVTATWPTVSATFSSAMPNTGAFPATPVIIPQYSGGGFGMKLDKKPPVMQGSFDLYAAGIEVPV